MDTGFNENFMSRALVTELGLDEDIQTASERIFEDISGKHFTVKCSVRLPFSAGVKKTEFAEHFMVLEDSDIDILLGEPALRHAHALTIDPDHENPPEHDVVGRMPGPDDVLSVQRVYLPPVKPNPCMAIFLPQYPFVFQELSHCLKHCEDTVL